MSALCRDEQLALRFIIGQLTFLGVQKSILGKPSQLVPNILKQQEEENNNGYFLVVVLITYILGHMALVHACSICKAHLLCRHLFCNQSSVCFRQACNWYFKFFPRNVFLSCVIALMAQHGVVRTRGNSCISALRWGRAFLVREKNS